MTGGGRAGAGCVSAGEERARSRRPDRPPPGWRPTSAAAACIVPVLTAVLAFFIGGLVVLVTGHNPISTYKAIFNGTGLNWFFPWTPSADRHAAALNLQQTLIITTPLILTGLAVAFAFRAGLFNIGGQGQYIIGSIVAVWVGSSFAGMPRVLHIVLAIARRGAGGGALWAGIAGRAEGDRRRQRGDLHDHAQLDRDLARRRTCSASAGRCRTPTAAVRARVQRHRRRARSCRCSGATRSCRACTSACSSRSPRWSCSGCC